jgi:hypothetical protein
MSINHAKNNSFAPRRKIIFILYYYFHLTNKQNFTSFPLTNEKNCVCAFRANFMRNMVEFVEDEHECNFWWSTEMNKQVLKWIFCVVLTRRKYLSWRVINCLRLQAVTCCRLCKVLFRNKEIPVVFCVEGGNMTVIHFLCCPFNLFTIDQK